MANLTTLLTNILTNVTTLSNDCATANITFSDAFTAWNTTSTILLSIVSNETAITNATLNSLLDITTNETVTSNATLSNLAQSIIANNTATISTSLNANLTLNNLIGTDNLTNIYDGGAASNYEELGNIVFADLNNLADFYNTTKASKGANLSGSLWWEGFYNSSIQYSCWINSDSFEAADYIYPDINIIEGVPAISTVSFDQGPFCVPNQRW